MSTARKSLKLAVMTMASRVLGLIRDHFQAVFFGTGPIAAAWEVAYLLPNMLRNLLAEGVLSQAFIPVYSSALAESREEARRVSGVIVSFLFLFLLILVGLGVASFPVLLPLYAGNLGEIDLLVRLAQVMFLFIATASLTAVFAGVANSHLLFTVPALSPILLNLVFIGGFVYLGPRGYDARTNAEFLAFVVVAGGVVQLFSQAAYLKYKGLWPALTLRFRDPALKKIYLLMAPAVLGAALFQINQLLDIAMAAYFIPEDEGAVPGLRFAHRLVQLPTGIIGVALATVVLPALAAGLRNNPDGDNGPELSRAAAFSLFLTVPAGIGLFMLGPSIINLLFFGGAWTAESTDAVWTALRFYVLGVPAYSLNKILTSSFYAYQDTRTPVRVSMVTVCINVTLNFILVHSLYQGGLALSTAFCSWLTSFALFVLLGRKIASLSLRALGSSLFRLLPGWLALAAFLLALQIFGLPFIERWGVSLAEYLSSPAIPRYQGMVHTLSAVVGGLVVYFGTGMYLRWPELRALRRRA